MEEMLSKYWFELWVSESMLARQTKEDEVELAWYEHRYDNRRR